jgi:cytochrome c-type biogenesis protein CcsB
MEKILKGLFSMKMMALAMLIFLIAIGSATLIESKYDIQTAKIIIYNALWFEILLVFLTIHLVVNIFRYNMIQREKIAMLSFHLSFIVILIGAAFTRFVSYEGMMLIREGESSNFIYASDPHLWFRINDGKMQYSYNEKLFMSEQTDNSFSIKVDFPNHSSKIKIEYVDFKKKQIDTLLINDSIQTSVLEIVTDGMKSNYLPPNDFTMLGEIPISFDKINELPGVEISKKGNDLFLKTKLPMRYLPMSEMQKARETGSEVPESMFTEIPTDSSVPFLSTTLYLVNGQQFVFRREIPNSKMTKMSSGRKDVGLDILTVKVSDGNDSKIIELEGGMSAIPAHVVFSLNGLSYEMEYGSTRIDLPFSIFCRDFQLDRYPGSQVASSFASEVTIIDERKNFRKDQRIFMNNVMDYDGLRFFQSSYDPDEKGTRLSVNSDFWGTNITYVGYLLMSIGMILSLFAPKGRFKELLEKIKKSRSRRESTLSLLFIIGISLTSFTQNETNEHHRHDGHEHHEENHNQQPKNEIKTPIFRIISKEHSEELASLLIQSYEGRIVPFHTLSDQLLRKIYGKNTFENHNAIQTILSMHMYPDHWMSVPIISVPKVVQERLKIGKYANYIEMTHENGEFKWINEYNKAHQKLEANRDEFDKKIIKLVERYQVLQSIFAWQYMKLIPLKNDENNMWYIPLSLELMKRDSISSSLALKYLSSVDDAAKNNSYGNALDQLNALKVFQKETATKIIPSDSLVAWEIRYNKMNIFKNTMYSYLILGFVLLVVFFIRVFVKPTKESETKFKKISTPFVVLIAVIFLYHAMGLALRWYISDHAPWSNGYEAVIFIAWVTMIAGFVFARKNPVVLAGTAILAFFMIFVTELNLLDPEITPLQPVLKSYWLMIHVAIITGSYGFLGLGAILGLLNLSLYIFRNEKNGTRITSHINEITGISELTITIGLFMLTIGTFLGGVWANESWGRYWGWDPKETWALVSVLVYAVILHLRYIPSLRGNFTFNVVSLWGYSAILFTFFGVNFYLVGLHSYAQGEGLGVIPNWIFYTVVVFVIYTVFASYRNKMYTRSLKD